MLKRFSSTFRKDKDRPTVSGDVRNGAPNGSTNGTSGKPTKRRSSFGITKGVKPENHQEQRNGHVGPAPADHGTSEHGVAAVFKQYAQVIHAAQRPMPTQTGDGSYIVEKVPSGLFQDLKSMGFKDINTLMDVMKDKADGKLQDDKTYLMERVIQVRRQWRQWFDEVIRSFHL